MHRHAMTAILLGLLALPAVPALAEDAPPASLPATASAKAESRLAAVRARAQKAKPDEGKKAEEQLATASKDLDADAAKTGDAAIASRLATKFGLTTDELLADRSTLGGGWGEVLIAQTLVSDSKSGLTIDQVQKLRSEGMGWGQIARGMGVKLGTVVRAVKSEAKPTGGGAAKSNGVSPSEASRPDMSHGANPHGGGVHAGGASAGVRSAGASIPRGHGR